MGNVRLSYNKNLSIIEENNYYPFGLKQEDNNNVINSLGNATANKYKYNGKELQDEKIGGNQLNLYDYGARNYDPALGRWMNIDPLAEISRRFSPYTYVLNNPVYFIDPDGMAANDPYVHDSQNLNGRHEMWSDRHPTSSSNSDIEPNWKGFTGESYYDETDNTAYQANADGTWTQSSELSEVVVSPKKQLSFLQNYYKGYFDSYKYIDDPNPYSPYTPDGYAITVYGSIDYNFTTYSMSNSLVLDGNTNKLAGFGTTGIGVSSTLGFSWNFGLSVEILDKYDTGMKDNSSLFDRMLGNSLGGGATYLNWGVTHSQSSFYDKSTNQFLLNKDTGVMSSGIQYNAKPGIGLNYGATKTNRLF